VTAPPAPSAGFLVLRGTAGLLKGECLLLRAGQEATLGRGSGSTLPLTRSAGYRALATDPSALRQSCQGVSRVHFRVAVPAPGVLEIADLSRAGTYVDGARIGAPVRLEDLRERGHGIRFGRDEVLEARWIDLPAAPAPG
jgi:hypothetical protein